MGIRFMGVDSRVYERARSASRRSAVIAVSYEILCCRVRYTRSGSAILRDAFGPSLASSTGGDISRYRGSSTY